LATSTLNELASTYVAPQLARAGFRRRRLVWNRWHDSFVHVVELGQSRWSDEHETDFGVSIGVLVIAAHRIVWGEEPSSVLKLTDFMLPGAFPGGRSRVVHDCV